MRYRSIRTRIDMTVSVANALKPQAEMSLVGSGRPSSSYVFSRTKYKLCDTSQCMKFDKMSKSRKRILEAR